jgi:hypothetical protein
MVLGRSTARCSILANALAIKMATWSGGFMEAGGLTSVNPHLIFKLPEEGNQEPLCGRAASHLSKEAPMQGLA